jgi:hypothetical protein
MINDRGLLEINKVNLDGSINELFKRDLANEENKWMPVYIGIKARNDFFIEFKGEVGAEFNSIIALDEIALHPIEKCQCKLFIEQTREVGKKVI